MGSTGNNLVLDPLAALHLNNQLYIIRTNFNFILSLFLSGNLQGTIVTNFELDILWFKKEVHV